MWGQFLNGTVLVGGFTESSRSTSGCQLLNTKCFFSYFGVKKQDCCMSVHSLVWLFQKFKATFLSFSKCHLYLSAPILPFHGRENHTDSKASLRSLPPPWCPWCQSLQLMRSSEGQWHHHGYTATQRDSPTLAFGLSILNMNCFFSLTFRNNRRWGDQFARHNMIL